MKNSNVASLRAVVLVLWIASCPACDTGRASPPGGDGNLTYSDGRPQDFKGCSFVKKKQCWACGGCTQETYPIIGCKAKNQCGQFCSACMPGGYVYCGEEPNCIDWPAPRGSLEDCDQVGSPGFAYSCYFCAYLHLSAAYAKGADGKCLMFWTPCFPAGYQLCDMIDGGVD